MRTITCGVSLERAFRFSWDVVVSFLLLFSHHNPPLLGNKHMCASSSIYYYISILPLSHHSRSRPLTPTSLPGSKVHHPQLRARSPTPAPRPRGPRSGLAVPLPQRPIAFEVIPIHHATNDRQLSAHPFTMYSIYLIPIFEATRRQWGRMQETERKRGVGGVCILCGQ